MALPAVGASHSAYHLQKACVAPIPSRRFPAWTSPLRRVVKCHSLLTAAHAHRSVLLRRGIVCRTALQDKPTAVTSDREGTRDGDVLTNTASVEDDEDEVEFPPPLTVAQRLQRAAYFWSRAIPIFLAYKALEARIALIELQTGPLEEDEKEAMWARQHASAADQIYDVISTLKGFYVKSGQLVATRIDIFPVQFGEKLISLTDDLDPMPFNLVRRIVEQELLAGQKWTTAFEWIEEVPLGSASVAQVHKAKLMDGRVVAVKVQRPNIEPRMLGDIANLKAAAKRLRSQIPIDYYIVFSELEKQLRQEFDFNYEANSMDSIADSLSRDSKGNPQSSPVKVPRSIPEYVSKRVLVMEYIEGVALSNFQEELHKRGIETSALEAKVFGRALLSALTEAFGRMIFTNGFFHGDPHPGNIFIRPNGQVALIDFGQTKRIPDTMRYQLATVIKLLSEKYEGKVVDMDALAESARALGVRFLEGYDNSTTAAATAMWLFDNVDELPGGFSSVNELSPDSPVAKVQSFPDDLVLVGRATVLLRGISARVGVKWSVAKEWRKFAMEVLEPETSAHSVKTPTSLRRRVSAIWQKILDQLEAVMALILVTCKVALRMLSRHRNNRKGAADPSGA